MRAPISLAIGTVLTVLTTHAFAQGAAPAAAPAPSPAAASPAAASLAQSTSNPATSVATSPASDMDKAFLQDEAQGTAYELAIAKLAAEKAVKPAVKSYAQVVVADHEQLNAQLSQVAQMRQVSLPTAMKDKDLATFNRLQKLSGAEFDRAYVRETTRINRDDKQQDTRELSRTQDPAVKSFVSALQQADQKHYALGSKLS